MSLIVSPSQPPARARATAAALGLGLVALLLLTSCSGYQRYRQAQLAEQRGDWDAAVLHYLEIVEQEPDNIAYRASLMRAKIQAAQEHFQKGKRFAEAGVYERALVELRQAVELDPTNQYAESELRKLIEEMEALRRQSAPMSIEEMKASTRGARPQPPQLNPRSEEPIDLLFPEPTPVIDIYRALGKAYGINVLFDPKLKDQQIPIELYKVTAQDALEILMRTVGHFYKVLDEQSIIIADDTPQNRRNYEDQVIQTFFLSNAEVKDVMTMIRTLIGAKNVAANEQLNAIVLRDTADKVKVAEQIILANDKAKAEVVVDVELLQINTSRLQELGLSLTANQVGASLDLGGDDVPLRLSDVEFLNANNWVLTVPSFLYDFLKTSAEAQLLAQPKLRISEGEKANLVIGDRVPIPTTTFNTSTVAGTNIVPVTSFQYQEVGIQIDIEPRVHHNEEISLQIKVEVSNISGQVEGSGGQQQPIIGTRTIESNIRLRDGETNFLAGLIRTDEITSGSGIPGLSDIPVFGRLFSNNRTDNQRTDIVLTLTPHIIRRADIREADLLPIWVGTESNITFRGGSPRVESNVQGPFDAESTRQRIEERLRRRLRSLPSGLQNGNSGNLDPEDGDDPNPVDNSGEEEAAQGVDLGGGGG
ncbi:MAG: secretin N-terminal domain-containing protein [Acidobacteriota bacterium]